MKPLKALGLLRQSNVTGDCPPGAKPSPQTNLHATRFRMGGKPTVAERRALEMRHNARGVRLSSAASGGQRLELRVGKRGPAETAKLRKLWSLLHLQAVSVTDWAAEKRFVFTLGQATECARCAREWSRLLRKSPPHFREWSRAKDGKYQYFIWGVDRHNEVNISLDKPTLTYRQAARVWRVSTSFLSKTGAGRKGPTRNRMSSS